MRTSHAAAALLFLATLEGSSGWGHASFRTKRRHASRFYSSSSDPSTTTTTFTVPCFPLQKSLRFPTDAIGLNLHEPRFLALADHVLGTDNQTFGAIYSGNKPHVVPGGLGSPTLGGSAQYFKSPC